jgi:murein DD-endopeptidase MepM/ murein hydrolase activator NlpD
MLVPEREKGVRSFRIPKIVFQAFVFLSVAFVILLGILSYDYIKILSELHLNKHLTIENRQLREQIQLFQMKINALNEDLERIDVFEKKLRIITGIEDVDMTQGLKNTGEAKKGDIKVVPPQSSINSGSDQLKRLDNFTYDEDYLNLKQLYEQKIATSFGLLTGYTITKEWSELSKQSFSLAGQYASFDFKFNILKKFVKDLEVGIHQLDQFILDKESFLRSTPTLLPTKGWITSYYGPRKSHYAGRVKMHEGLDVGAKNGEGILATADGVVIFSGHKPGFGKFVQMDHGYGVETIFAHASKLNVKKGEIIKRGQTIAYVGSTGYSTGPHVHYEVRVNGTPVDPLYFILD